MTSDELKKIGVACYGEKWFADMCRATGIHRQSLWRWTTGYPIDQTFTARLQTLIAQRISELEHALEILGDKKFFLNPETKTVSTTPADGWIEVTATPAGDWVVKIKK